MELLVLREGVRLGTEDNPVVTVPEAPAPLIVDAGTLNFLLELQRGAQPNISDDPVSQESIRLLAKMGIIESTGRSIETTEAASRYGTTITDLVIKRPSPWIGAVVRSIAVVTRPLTSWAGVLTGLLLLMITSVYSTLIMPVQPTVDFVSDNALGFILTAIVWQMLRGAAHESGHYAVARATGQDPPVGMGLYLYGPVLYVDLTCLDTQTRSIRIRADLAGAAIDGWVTAGLTGLYLATSDSTTAALLLTSCAVALSNLRPTDKYDGFWALRDLLEARPMSATWAAPRKLLKAVHSQRAADRRFARTLIALYAVAIIWFAISAPRWLAGTVSAAVAEPGRITNFAVIALVYSLVATAAVITARRPTTKG
ncbi:hypothetical protein PV772_19705 [Pseudarthrobacter sp. CC12]|uniref:hypothetical protein n=1 Tax=Pseudarthrobacter sp. CC12 TaxID=3029193 RepID=UPI0032631F22